MSDQDLMLADGTVLETTKVINGVARYYKPVYEPLNLGEIDERYAGQSLPILRNPTRRFRRSFLISNSDEYVEGIAFIMGVEREKVNELLDDMEDAITAYIFLGVWDDGRVKQLPHVYKLWDSWSAERSKEFATR